ncbi:transmembrane protein 235-like [Lampris incognitus]|uniref:transmembrane protein 235-like n=1 Tax=Lampris incognitus TaxID=2546036 RepID=UPI0024B6098C|nr:transmembrane protein 235-like [Lampris incognitus]
MTRYRLVILSAGFTGLLSFGFLAVAFETDYWYIIDVAKPNDTGADDLSSHSGLWRIYEGENSTSLIPSFAADSSNFSEVQRHLLGLHRVVIILLPLSLVLLVFGWIFGLVSSLARSPNLLAGSASYFLFCSLFTLSGVSIYINYSQHAMEEFQRVVSPEDLAYVDVSFGWSLAMAWLSYSLEVVTGLLLLLAAWIIQQKRKQDSGVTMAVV